MSKATGPLVRSVAGAFLATALCWAPSVAAEDTARDASRDTAKALAPAVHDLATRRGVASVYRRVQAIAELNCVAVADVAAPLSAAEKQCRDQVLERLLGQLADPYLSYLHANPEEILVAQR